MLYFESDYMEGAHESILKRLIETNMVHESGYGVDSFCSNAKAKIRDACGKPEADIFFFAGGTQTNKTVIDSILKNYEGVVTAATGHISLHEAGAVEASGHKVLTLPQHEGKIDCGELREFLENFWNDGNKEQMTFPGMVYISHPTEYGTLYTKSELEALHEICSEYGIPLYLDGARLGYGLAAPVTDVTLRDIAELCHVFYIGGTKVGALCGEAVVFSGMKMPCHFVTTVRQNGALLSKGRLLGVQFETLFSDDLYTRIAKNATALAARLREILKEKGYREFIVNNTNQVFVILENEQMKKLSSEVRFGFWEKYDKDHTVVRFATSWATTSEDVEKLGRLL